MKIKDYLAAVKAIDDHIADKKAEKNEIILTACELFGITDLEFAAGLQEIED